MIAHVQILVPLFGQINMDMLADLSHVANESFNTYTPFLGFCERDPLNLGFNVDEFFSAAYSKSSNITAYVGNVSVPWDSSNSMWKFTTARNLTDFEMDTYFDISTGNLVWFHLPSMGIVARLSNGMVPATFKDSDFVI